LLYLKVGALLSGAWVAPGITILSLPTLELIERHRNQLVPDAQKPPTEITAVLALWSELISTSRRWSRPSGTGTARIIGPAAHVVSSPGSSYHLWTPCSSRHRRTSATPVAALHQPRKREPGLVTRMAPPIGEQYRPRLDQGRQRPNCCLLQPGVLPWPHDPSGADTCVWHW
jgi:hypothetical protein